MAIKGRGGKWHNTAVLTVTFLIYGILCITMITFHQLFLGMKLLSSGRKDYMTENNGDNKDCVTGNGAFLSMNTPSRPIIAIIGCCDWEWGQQHQPGHLWPRVPET